MSSAPGKVLWAGEYAVLDGARAVVCAVDRRARATLRAAAQPLSPFLEAARRELEAHFGPGSSEAAAAAHVSVDSSALESDDKKLGLGSSAAATVAAIAAAAPRASRQLIHQLAHRAHAAAQAPRGARGSGADIAASVHGGLLAVQRPPGADDLTPLLVTPLPYPPGLTFALVWTAIPADTPALVSRVRAFRALSPGAHATCTAAIAAAADALAAALTAGDPRAAVAAVDAGAEALAALGDAAGAPLVPAAAAAARDLARRHGGAAKPTGAGGGDLILALFATPQQAAAFRDEAAAQGMVLIQTDVDLQGVRL